MISVCDVTPKVINFVEGPLVVDGGWVDANMVTQSLPFLFSLESLYGAGFQEKSQGAMPPWSCSTFSLNRSAISSEYAPCVQVNGECFGSFR